MTRRIRSIKPEWLDDEKMGSASDEARVLSVALMLMADDHGRGRASISAIASGAWQYQMGRDDGAHAPETLAKASRAFRELLAMGFVVQYEVSGQRYYEIRNWTKHQRVDKVGKPQVPTPNHAETHVSGDSRESFANPSRESRETLATDLDLEGIRKGEDREHAREGSGVYRAYVEQLGKRAARFDTATPDKLRLSALADTELRQTATLRGTSAETLLSVALDRWFSDPWAKSKGFPFEVFARQVTRLATAEAGAVTKTRGGMAPPASHAEHAASVAQAVAEGREHGEGWADVGI